MKTIWAIILITLPLLCALSTSCDGKSSSMDTKPKKEEVIDSFAYTFPKISDSTAKELKDSLYTLFKTVVPFQNFNGMVLVSKNGKIVYERYLGMANEKTGLKISKETPIHVASISKVITAVTVLRLVDKKRIELDVPVTKYLKDFPYPDVQVRHLLNHRSGIPNYAYFPDSLLPKKNMLSTKGVLRLLKKYNYPLYFPPGTHFSYCNSNYALLALIVEEVTKTPFPKFVKKELFDPLKMTHSFIATDTALPKNVALSYNSKKEFQEYNNLDAVYGDKNLYTTARDLFLLDKALYSDNFLSAKMKKEMMRGYSYEKPGKSNYGLGFRLREEKGKSTFVFHTGWWHGNTGCYAHLVEDNACMVIISNHYTKSVFGINQLSNLFGDYPYAPLIDSKENFVSMDEAIERLK
jgi:CubicO group peptidase (beta-lactamase class C family)